MKEFTRTAVFRIPEQMMTPGKENVPRSHVPGKLSIPNSKEHRIMGGVLKSAEGLAATTTLFATVREERKHC